MNNISNGKEEANIVSFKNKQLQLVETDQNTSALYDIDLYFKWVANNKDLINRLLQDLTFGFDTYHIEAINERLESIIESSETPSILRCFPPDAVLKNLMNE